MNRCGSSRRVAVRPSQEPPTPPSGPVETCDTAGILNTAVNLAASIQVTEALKYLTGARDAMRRSLLSWDLWQNERSEISAAVPRHDALARHGHYR